MSDIISCFEENSQENESTNNENNGNPGVPGDLGQYSFQKRSNRIARYSFSYPFALLIKLLDDFWDSVTRTCFFLLTKIRLSF